VENGLGRSVPEKEGRALGYRPQVLKRTRLVEKKETEGKGLEGKP